jgi:hypothetical protein
MQSVVVVGSRAGRAARVGILAFWVLSMVE